ncbi:MAG: hypothetical protein QM639_16035 [Rhodocyclaceae bacterium]
MSIDTLLNRLDRVRKTGPHSWIARCPTRDDRKPSLSVRELDDGRVLIHDFGGDSVDEILSVLNLGFDALFPDKPIGNARSERAPFSYADALRCIDFEATVVAVAAGNIANGIELTNDDLARLLEAASRITRALEACQCR